MASESYGHIAARSRLRDKQPYAQFPAIPAGRVDGNAVFKLLPLLPRRRSCNSFAWRSIVKCHREQKVLVVCRDRATQIEFTVNGPKGYQTNRARPSDAPPIGYYEWSGSVYHLAGCASFKCLHSDDDVADGDILARYV